MELLREHNVTLKADRLVLRPMTEGDWHIILPWESDPDVTYYFDGDYVSERVLEDTQMIYRGVSQKAFMFIVELDTRPIGVCWLQEMNLERILTRLPEKNLRRIDLAIGDKDLWGQGWGTKIIATLTAFGFEQERADAIFGCSIGDYNPRSRRAFKRNGYRLFLETPQPEGHKAKVEYDLMIGREEHAAR